MPSVEAPAVVREIASATFAGATSFGLLAAQQAASCASPSVGLLAGLVTAVLSSLSLSLRTACQQPVEANAKRWALFPYEGTN